jgi:ABC-2 type transport system ATP-binding protein
VGENGNGKTTLLRILFGELMPDQGNVTYSFRRQAEDFYQTKSNIAFIPQRSPVWYGSLMSNLQFASTFAGSKGRENELWTEMILARMGLRTFRTYTWSRISSGYKMRFELARTLITRPEILLLDEPLANLDILAQQIILEDLRFLAQSHTMPLSIMLSSQQLYEVEKVSDEVIFLRNGKAQYQPNLRKGTVADQQLIVEMESTASRAQLQEALENAGLQRVSFNGGVFILYFPETTSISTVMSALGQKQIPVKYLRDISVSSRRFFDA